jgi:EAL and modified HD-GYP domain-containing signal transduction protein
MYSYIARQPIFDREMRTIAYELLFRDGMNNAFPDVSPEYATSRVISDQFLCIPVPRIACSHSAYINVPHQMLISGRETLCRTRMWLSKFLKTPYLMKGSSMR